MSDLLAALATLAVTVVAVASYSIFIVVRVRPRFARVEKEGESVLLGPRLMEATHWTLEPLGRACVRAGISANHVTGASLVLGAGAGLALGSGHWGIGGALAAISAFGDTLDGIVARAANTCSPAGETLDAAVDRYNDFFFLAGVAYAVRGRPGLFVLALGAISASFMVSYASAKAEAMQATVSRGSMRRPERAAYLTLGVLLVPIVSAFWPDYALTPVALSLGLVAIVGNASAVRRFAQLMAFVRGARPQRSVASEAKPAVARTRSEVEGAYP